MEAQCIVHLVGIGRRVFSVGRLAGCGSPSTESMLTALGLSQAELMCTNLNMQNHEKHESRRTQNTLRNPPTSPATATTSRRRATKHVQRVSPYSLATIDPGLVEIGLVQLSQVRMEKTTSVASFPWPVVLFDSSSEKREKKQPITATSNRHSDPHRASHSFKAARLRWKES